MIITWNDQTIFLPQSFIHIMNEYVKYESNFKASYIYVCSFNIFDKKEIKKTEEKEGKKIGSIYFFWPLENRLHLIEACEGLGWVGVYPQAWFKLGQVTLCVKFS